jgi:hypothetical protein
MTTGSNIDRALRSTHPLDIGRVRAVAQLVHGKPLTDCELESLWRLFSGDKKLFGQWMTVNDLTLAEFESWLKK